MNDATSGSSRYEQVGVSMMHNKLGRSSYFSVAKRFVEMGFHAAGEEQGWGLNRYRFHTTGVPRDSG